MRKPLFGITLAIILLATKAFGETDVYYVTLTEGPDQPEQNEYTFAGAIEAANASESPAEIIIDLYAVWLHDGGVDIVHPVTIRNAEEKTSVAIATTFDEGAVLRFSPGASGSTVRGVRFSNELLYLEGRTGDAVALSLCATDLVFEDLEIYSYHMAVEADCPEAVDALFFSGVLSRNKRDVGGVLMSGSVLAFDETTFHFDVGGVDLRASDCGAQLIIKESRFRHFGAEESAGSPTGVERQIYDSAMINLEGCIDVELSDSVIQGRSPLLTAAPLEGAEGLANVEIINSVIQRTESLDEAPLISFDGDNFTMRHASIWANRLTGAAACIELKGGQLLLDHSVIADNGCYPDVLAGAGELDIRYSLLGSLANDGAAQAMDVSSSMLLGQDPLIDEVMSVPLQSSPVIDAGDPARVPGTGSTPETDVRGSARLTGEALDLGAIEFNNPPVFDDAAFYRDLRNRADHAEAGETIVMHLLDYVSDPDGHDIVDVEMLWMAPVNDLFVPMPVELPDFDPVTASISGTEEHYRGAWALFEFRDELGLSGYGQPEFDNAWRRQGGGSSSSGPISSLWFALTMALFLRRAPGVAKRLTSIV